MNKMRKLGASLRRHGPTAAIVAITAAAVLVPELAFAGSSQSMPWDSPIKKFTDSLTGPIAYGVSLTALAIGIIGTLWGGELNDMLRTVFKLTFGIAALVFAAQVLSSLFGVSGATIVATAPLLAGWA